ncbi:MAG: ankyrin repeat domain-containing protein [Bdellovibrionales bacterium]|nr:ankyrin repeat domain-containing protein [Bdellovibrionales bacterium]
MRSIGRAALEFGELLVFMLLPLAASFPVIYLIWSSGFPYQSHLHWLLTDGASVPIFVGIHLFLVIKMSPVGLRGIARSAPLNHGALTRDLQLACARYGVDPPEVREATGFIFWPSGVLLGQGWLSKRLHLRSLWLVYPKCVFRLSPQERKALVIGIALCIKRRQGTRLLLEGGAVFVGLLLSLSLIRAGVDIWLHLNLSEAWDPLIEFVPAMFVALVWTAMGIRNSVREDLEMLRSGGATRREIWAHYRHFSAAFSKANGVFSRVVLKLLPSRAQVQALLDRKRLGRASLGPINVGGARLGLAGGLLACATFALVLQAISGRLPELNLALAAGRGDSAEVSRLLQVGVSPNGTWGEWNRGTPLHFAVGRGHTEVIKLLLENGAQPDMKNSLGATPMISAARGGRREIASVLLSHGADPRIKDSEGLTPFDYATRKRGELSEKFDEVELRRKDYDELLKVLKRAGK